MLDKKKEKKKINTEKSYQSGLASFVERPVPGEEELIDFERALRREVRDQEIDLHLNDVYSDKKGRRVDVGRLEKKKRPNLFLKIFKFLFFILLVSSAAYYAYVTYFQNNNDISSLRLEISGPEKIGIGEEFSYVIEYHNPSKYVFSDINLEMQYPKNFVFLSASISPENGNYSFSLPNLGPEEKAKLTITGKIINTLDSVNLAIARLEYKPSTFSSRFQKEDSISTLSGGLGFFIDVESSGMIFVGQDNEIKINFSENNNEEFFSEMSDFNIVFSFKEGSGAEISQSSKEVSQDKNEDVLEVSKMPTLEKLTSYSWQLSSLNREIPRHSLSFNYKTKNKVDDFEIKISLEKKIADKNLVFYEKTIKPELVSSDLSLALFLNASKSDQPLDFGDDLNYTLNYSNLGSKSYQDVVVMAVINGSLVDWNSLWLEKGGEKRSSSIIFTKNEIPELAEIKPGESGEINFRLKLKNYQDSYLGQDLSVSSYAQYNLASQTSSEGSKSNSINSPINSDFSFREKVLYFNEDNFPVGSGPLPPEIGAKTVFRVYWKIENNINELRDARAYFQLPAYLNFEGQAETEVGQINFDNLSRQVVWEIGLIPLSSRFLEASFNISLMPEEKDRDKILVLSPGSFATAVDSITRDDLSRKTSAKTTRLEDDEIANFNNSGRVQ